MAEGDLTTVDLVRKYLGVEDFEDDAFIALLITSSSAWLKAEIGRDYTVSDYVHEFNGDGSRGVTLPVYPVVSVASVSVDDEAVPERTETTGTGWVLSGGRVELVGYRFSAGVENCQIVYRAGEEAPADVGQAALEHVAIRFRDKQFGGATYKLQGGDIVDRRGESSSGSWAFIRSVIAHYRRYTV